ncbi:hypothetical protein KAX35_06605, partial [candidate division WOR-3 bacterium]|nr:hypothetical protein [candidate division WOR-3 bacterium]
RCVVEYGPPPEHDVGVTEIIAPAGGYPVGEIVTPQVEVKNFGTNDETFDVTIEWPEKYSETQAGVFVTSGDIDTVEFTPFTTVAGSYAVTAYTYLADDVNPDNDTLEGSFGVSAWYEDFELGDGGFESVVISNEPPAEWEWGICNSADYAGGNPPGPDAYSGTHCWATDLDGDYLNYADYYMWNDFIATADNPILSFYHWYNIFGAWDGGNVKLSTDGGGTWTVISPIGGYDDEGGSACNGESVFCYVHSWWEEVTFDLTPYSITEGQIFQIKWHMMSSTVVGDYPGWYVDDMSGVSMEPFLAEHDVAVHEILAPEGLVEEGDVYPQVVVKNPGANEETFPVTFQIWGAKQDYTSTETITLAPGLMDTVDFTDTFAATGGSYTTLAYTALAEDENTSNDSIWGEFSVVEWSEDLEEDDGGFEAILDDGFIGWQWGIPTNPEGPANAHSGENVWATNLAGDYDNNADFSLIREFIALSDNPILYFWHWYDTENRWDGGNVKLSTDDGGSWTVISPMGGYDDVGHSACDEESLFTG